MSKPKKIIIGLFVGLLILANCNWISFRREEPLRIPELPERPYGQTSDWHGETGLPEKEISLYRPAYNMGSCKQLSGTIHTVNIFVNCAEKRWTEREAQVFCRKILDPGYRMVEDWAGQRGIELAFDNWHLISNGDYRLYLKKSAVTVSKEDEILLRKDLLDELAKQLGFRGGYEMNAYFQQLFHTDQVVYSIIFNKPGRCFAYQDNVDGSHDLLEFSCFYTKHSDGLIRGPESVAHETLHLFGAEDYYDPYGDLPERKKLAEQACPDDIMLSSKVTGPTEVSDITV